MESNDNINRRRHLSPGVIVTPPDGVVMSYHRHQLWRGACTRRKSASARTSAVCAVSSRRVDPVSSAVSEAGSLMPGPRNTVAPPPSAVTADTSSGHTHTWPANYDISLRTAHRRCTLGWRWHAEC